MASRYRSSSVGKTTKSNAKGSRKASVSEEAQSSQMLEENENAFCGDCAKICSDNDKALFCNMCERWFHAACQKVNDEMYEVLSNDSNSPTTMIFWYCKSSCSLFARKMVNSMCDLKKGLESVKGDVKQTMSRVDNIEKGKLTTELRDSVKKIVHEETNSEEVQNKLQDVIQKVDKVTSENFDDKCKQLEAVNKFMNAKEKEQRLEYEERTRRQTNLVIFKLPESECEQERDQKVDDEENVGRLLNEIGAYARPVFMKRLNNKKPRKVRQKETEGSNEEQDSEAIRTEDNKIRPVFLKFESQFARDDVMRAFGKAKKAISEDEDWVDEGYLMNKVSMRRDMTPKERADEDELYKELKKKTDESKKEKDQHARWIRRGGRVVNIGKYPAKKLQ